MCWEVHRMFKTLYQKYLQNIANVWFQKSRVSSRSRNVQVSVSSRVFAQSLGLSLEDFGRDSSSEKHIGQPQATVNQVICETTSFTFTK